MQAVIMAGGRGTRLMPLTSNTPKPMVKLADKPVMLYAVELLKKHGVTDIAATLGYLPEQIQNYFGNGKKFGVKMTYFTEKVPLGTAGGVKNCASFLREDTFLVLSADGYSEANLSAAIRFHKSKRSLLTVVAKKMDDPVGLGVLERDESGVIRSFAEKPEGVSSALVNTGIYVLDRRVLERIPDGPYDFGRQLLPDLVGVAYAYLDDAYWSDIGTLKSYYETNKKLAQERVFA